MRRKTQRKPLFLQKNYIIDVPLGSKYATKIQHDFNKYVTESEKSKLLLGNVGYCRVSLNMSSFMEARATVLHSLFSGKKRKCNGNSKGLVQEFTIRT